MDTHHPQQQQGRQPPHLHGNMPSLPTHQDFSRTANSTPVSSPGLFSPTTNPRANLSFSSQPPSEGATPGVGGSPFLHPLQTHKVKETHVANVDRDFQTGRKLINQYEVINEIGRGQHGKVKLARDLETGDNVAIKIVPRLSKTRRLGKLSARDPQQNINREIAILKKIRHPNVVALLEVIDDSELRKIYMVLEHVERGEVVWRKKGLPHICHWERHRVEMEAKGEAIQPEEEDWVRNVERRAVIKQLKSMHIKSRSGPADPWSLEMGPTDDDGTRSSRSRSYTDHSDRSRPSNSLKDGYISSSRVPSRNQSGNSISQAAASPSVETDNLPSFDEDDLETPGPLRSNPTSSAALDGTMYGAYSEDPNFRARSPSMADSIISHMSSVDFEHAGTYMDDYDYVPCFTIDKARSAFRDTVLGLEYLHYQGVVHRDIKPANLLWTKDWRVKISDFGVSYFGRPIRDEENDDAMSESEAQNFDDDRELAKTVGTPAFFAPELCYTDLDREPPKVSEQIDVWSLGVTLFCLIFARIPFLADDEFAMFKKIATEEVYIPRRRLQPVDPFTDPSKGSLYKRINTAPYRNDNELAYEDVDEDLIDLLRGMLTKNPDKRIRLREVKRHRWVTKDIDSPVGWLDDTDPSRKMSGRKIQVDEREIGRAVVPLTFLERARSTFKRAMGKVMHRGDRGESSSRRRATSSAASSAGDSPAIGPALPFPREARRKSLRGDDYFATVTQLPTEHPLTQSVTASPQESPGSRVASGVASPDAASVTNAQTIPDTLDGAVLNEQTSPSASKSSTRHLHSRSITNATLSLYPALQEAQTVPTTPLPNDFEEDARDEDARHSIRRKSRDAHLTADELSRARSMDRAGLVFSNSDKRAEPVVGISTAFAPGSIQFPRYPRQMRSIDFRKLGESSPSKSASFGSSVSSSSCPHPPQPRSDTNTYQNQRMGTKTTERPATSHRLETRPDEVSLSTQTALPPTAESFAGTQPNSYKEPDILDIADCGLKASSTSCPPSPSLSSTDVLEARHAMIDTASSLADAIGSSKPGSPIDNEDSTVEFQSHPSLPALMSGASSVSADVDAELLGTPGLVDRHSLMTTSDSATPPALAKEPDSFPLRPPEGLADQQSSEEHIMPLDIAPAGATETASPSTLPETGLSDEDYDDSSDDGMLTMAFARKKKPPPKDTTNAVVDEIVHPARRRDTNTSVASTETAKKIIIEG